MLYISMGHHDCSDDKVENSELFSNEEACATFVEYRIFDEKKKTCKNFSTKMKSLHVNWFPE